LGKILLFLSFIFLLIWYLYYLKKFLLKKSHSGFLNGFCNFWIDYLAVSTAAVSTAAVSTAVVSTAIESTATESVAASSDLFELHAATDKEIARAKKPNLNEFFIV
jgi:hypothetical protein